MLAPNWSLQLIESRQRTSFSEIGQRWGSFDSELGSSICSKVRSRSEIINLGREWGMCLHLPISVYNFTPWEGGRERESRKKQRGGWECTNLGILGRTTFQSGVQSWHNSLKKVKIRSVILLELGFCSFDGGNDFVPRRTMTMRKTNSSCCVWHCPRILRSARAATFSGLFWPLCKYQ